MPRVRFFFVEGNIGTGKTTLIQRVESRLRRLGLAQRLVVVPEPIDRWLDVDGHNVLALFYEDPKRWGYTFQVHAMSTRITAVREAIAKAADDDAPLIVLCERSVYTDRFIFVETLHQDGIISDAERAAYVRAYDYFGSHDYRGEHAGVIYLRSRPQTCAQHMTERNRTEESSVSIDYLQRLHIAHEQAIASAKTWGGAPRLIIDMDDEALAELPSDDAAAQYCAERLYNFMV